GQVHPGSGRPDLQLRRTRVPGGRDLEIPDRSAPERGFYRRGELRRHPDRLGGHLVSGHVDGVGRVLEFRPVAESWHLAIEAPAALAKFIASKGSITVNGVSLTVNEVARARFAVNLIPHTCAVTTLGRLKEGDEVNLEVDLLARYLERLVAERGGS
ncbi:MAG: hypothetical protein F9K47_00555, partial [Burkholderiales bacterium]